jgi:hypothetical protein
MIKGIRDAASRAVRLWWNGIQPPSDYVVETLNEIILDISKKTTTLGFENYAKESLRKLLSVCNNYLGNEISSIIPRNVKIGYVLAELSGFGTTHDNVDITTLNRIVSILSNSEGFKRFCNVINPQRYVDDTGYTDKHDAQFVVALFINGGVENLMQVMFRHEEGETPDPIKCWLSLFFSQKTTTIITSMNVTGLNVNPADFVSYKTHLELMVKVDSTLRNLQLQPISDSKKFVEDIQVMVGQVPDDPKELIELKNCHLCCHKFSMVKQTPFTHGSSCSDETCRKANQACKQCSKEWSKQSKRCPFCRRETKTIDNKIPSFLKQLEDIEKQLTLFDDPGIKSVCQHHHAGLYPNFINVLRACEFYHSIDTHGKTLNMGLVRTLMEKLKIIQDAAVEPERRSRSRSRSPPQGAQGAQGGTTIRVKQRKLKTRKQRNIATRKQRRNISTRKRQQQQQRKNASRARGRF